MKLRIQCYCCGQDKNNNQWDGIEKEIQRSGNVSHTPCPECFELEKIRLDNEIEDFLSRHPTVFHRD